MDGLNFEPNLFRDLGQGAEEEFLSCSSPRGAGVTVVSPAGIGSISQQQQRQRQAVGSRLSENAKIFELLLSSHKPSGNVPSADVPSSGGNNNSSNSTCRPNDLDKNVQKVTFQESSNTCTGSAATGSDVPATDTSGSTSFDPFLPEHHQAHNPYLSSMLSLLPASASASAAPAPLLAATPSSAAATFHAKKRPRSLDTADNGGSGRDSGRYSCNMHNSGDNNTPLRSASSSSSSSSRATAATCSTPLSRFIELYEHDDDDDDEGGEEDEDGRDDRPGAYSPPPSPPPSSSSSSSSLLQLLRTRSPLAATGADRKQNAEQGVAHNRQFFTFDLAHTHPTESSVLASLDPQLRQQQQQAAKSGVLLTGAAAAAAPGHSGMPLVAAASHGTAGMSQNPPPAPCDPFSHQADLDSFLQCFSLTPLASARKQPQPRLSRDPRLTVASGSTHNGNDNDTGDGKVTKAAVSVLQELDEVIMESDREGEGEGEREGGAREGANDPSLPAVLQPLHAKLDHVLHPKKASAAPSGGIAQEFSPGFSLFSLGGAPSALPTLPPCAAAVASAASFAPPAPFETLLRRHAAPHGGREGERDSPATERERGRSAQLEQSETCAFHVEALGSRHSSDEATNKRLSHEGEQLNKKILEREPTVDAVDDNANEDEGE
jgi:hypothetical protein